MTLQGGYDVTRFVGKVRKDLLCFICNKVPEEPRLCKNKYHIFCLAHISWHLRYSQTCPVCRDPLTLETLRRPTGFLKNYLHYLKIKCKLDNRGCLDVVRLKDLSRHVDQSEIAPVYMRSRYEKCEMVVKKSDKDNHQQYLYQFRNAKYLKGIKASQDKMKTSQHEIKVA